jgi:hypothetical protein
MMDSDIIILDALANLEETIWAVECNVTSY